MTRYTGHIHNAKRCTFNNCDHYIVALHIDGAFRANDNICWNSVMGFNTLQEAQKHLKLLLHHFTGVGTFAEEAVRIADEIIERVEQK